jgi:hypothetical protein
LAVKGYADCEIFNVREKTALRAATALVRLVPEAIDGEAVRCHELARAVGRMLGLEHCDGRYGFVEHTWLWTEPFDLERHAPPWILPNVLDVYVPGSLPQVQLVHMGSTGLPPRYYLTNLPEPQVREDVVAELVKRFSVPEGNT